MTENANMNKTVFTFWEPRSAMPGYLRLCLETWRKFLPGWQIEVLDYERLPAFLPQDEIQAVVCHDMKLFNQADAIRCALLRRHGGVWLDLDTVVLRPNVLDRFADGEVSVICSRKGGVYGSFFVAAKPNSELMERWYGELVVRVGEFRSFHASLVKRLFRRKRWRQVRRWDFVLNAVLDQMVPDMSAMHVARYSEEDLHVHPEQAFGRGEAYRKSREVYVDYWFSAPRGDDADVLAWSTGGMALLHNSWTPPEFRRMDEASFLATGCRLAHVLKEVLG